MKVQTNIKMLFKHEPNQSEHLRENEYKYGFLKLIYNRNIIQQIYMNWGIWLFILIIIAVKAEKIQRNLIIQDDKNIRTV